MTLIYLVIRKKEIATLNNIEFKIRGKSGEEEEDVLDDLES